MMQFPKMATFRVWKDFIALILVVGTLFVSSYTVGTNSWWHSEKAIHDEACALGHSFTLGLDFDLDYSNEVSKGKYTDLYGGAPPVPPGLGVLAAPFVGAFSLLDRMSGHPVIQDHFKFSGSWAFFGIGFASSVCFLLGVLLYYRALRKHFDISPACVFLLCAGTGMLFYVLMRPLMAHSFEFFNYALNFYAATMLYKESSNRQWLYALLAAAATALSWLTRLHALFPVLLPAIIVLGYMLAEGTFDRRKFFSKMGKVAVCMGICAIPTLILMYDIYGGPVPKLSTYGNIHHYVPKYTTLFVFLGDIVELIVSRMKLIPVFLIGNSFPLWCFMPIVFFGVGALLLNGGREAVRKSKEKRWWILWLVSIIIYMAGPVVAVLLWRMPGGAYGFRYLLPLVPIGFLGFTLWRIRQGQTLSLFGNVFVSVLLVASIFGSLAPVAFNSNPKWSYTHSPINEFGLKEGASARDNYYRTIAWMEHPSFFRVALGYGPAFVFLPDSHPAMAYKKTFIKDNTRTQVLVMVALWIAGGLLLVRRPSEESDEEAPLKPVHVSLKTFVPVLGAMLLFWHLCFVYYQHQPEAENKTLEQVKELRDSIEAEKESKGAYPVQQGYATIKKGEGKIEFWYQSNGTDYKLIVLHDPNANNVALFRPDERDPARPWWAYGYWTLGARNW